MKLFFCIFWILIALSGCDTHTKTSENSALKWYSWKDGLAEASRTGKPLYLNLHADWCGPCHHMRRTTLKDSTVVAYLQQYFISVTLDEKDPGPFLYRGRSYATVNDLVQALNGRGLEYLPTHLFLYPSSKVSQASGYHPVQAFLDILKQARREK